jgi:exonuclease VII small subunit
MSDMQAIERHTKAYAEARSKLAEIVDALQTGIDALKRNALPQIRRQVARAVEAEAELRALVEKHPALFIKPKTVVLHGVKVGFEKGTGAIQIDDEEQCVKLIERRFPELVDQLIKVEKKPLKAGLATLTVAQLKSVGATVTEAGDRVVIRAVDKDVDKLVTALLKGATEEAKG